MFILLFVEVDYLLNTEMRVLENMEYTELFSVMLKFEIKCVFLLVSKQIMFIIIKLKIQVDVLVCFFVPVIIYGVICCCYYFILIIFYIYGRILIVPSTWSVIMFDKLINL